MPSIEVCHVMKIRKLTWAYRENYKYIVKSLALLTSRFSMEIRILFRVRGLILASSCRYQADPFTFCCDFCVFLPAT